MPTFSFLVSGLIFIQKTTFLSKIYNSSLYHRINAHVEKREYIAKETSSPRTFQNHLKHSFFSNFPVLMRSPDTSGVRKESWTACSSLFLSTGSEKGLPQWQKSDLLKPRCLPSFSRHSFWCSRHRQVARGSGYNLPSEALLLYSLRLITPSAHKPLLLL